MTAKIHPTAVIGRDVEIGEDTEIGPYVILEDGIKIGPRNRFMASTYVGRYTEIGADNLFYPYSTIGCIPQDLKFKEEPTKLVIGDRNVIREHSTLHRGTGGGGGVTRIGNENLLMVGSHVAHDCLVGNNSILSHGCALAGHVTVGNEATVGASSSVHQFCHVGDHAFIGGHSVVVKDAMPYVKSVGNHAKIYGINTIGLKRKGFAEQEVLNLKQAYRILFLKKLPLAEALQRLDSEYPDCARVSYLVSFIRVALKDRGITR